MTFRKNKQKRQFVLDVQLNEHTIEEVTSMKYLGVILDDKLTFKEHTDHIATKIKKGNCLLARIRHFITQKELLSFYHAHIQSHLNYGSIIWSAAAPTYVNRLSKLQEQSTKLISFVKSINDHNRNEIFFNLKILPLKKLIFLNHCKFIWKISHNYISENIQQIFTKNILPVRNFEENRKYIQPFRSTQCGASFITCSGIKKWNKVRSTITSMAKMSTFVTEMKSFLHNNNI